MSGASIVAVKVQAASNNEVVVHPIAPVVSRVAVSTAQNIVRAGAAVEGPRGPSGTQGDAGPQGQPGEDGAGDANFEMDFSVQSVVTVNHNLNKYPSTTVLDSAGDVCEGDVDHQSKNTLVLSFSAPFSGHVTCN